MAEVEGAACPKVVRSRAWDRKDLGQNLHASVTPIPGDLISLPNLFLNHLPVISSKCESIKGLVHWLDQGSYGVVMHSFLRIITSWETSLQTWFFVGTHHIQTTTALTTPMWKACHLFPAPCNLSAAIFSTHANYRASRFKLHSLSSPLLVPRSPGILKGDMAE